MLARQKKVKRSLSLGMQIIAFSSVFLLALPWLGYRYLDEMKEFLVQGQGDAQLLAARAIATVLHNRSDLFSTSATPTSQFIEESALYVYPLDNKLIIDGYGSDWNEQLSQKKAFNANNLVYDRTAGSVSPVAFGLLLGKHGKHLYGLVSVTDKNVVYRHPRYARLDSSDHVRIELVNADYETKRYVLLAEAPGNVSVYEMQQNWVKPITGKPEYSISSVWRDTSKGYDVEFRIPEKWLNEDQQLMISVADVNSEIERKIDTIVATLPNNSDGNLNKLVSRSPELDRIIKGLGYASSNVCIVDQYRRVRAVLGSNITNSALCSQTDKVSPELVSKALVGKSDVHRTLIDGEEALVIASHPIYQGETIIGAVLVEKNSGNILANQRKSLHKIVIATGIVFIIALTGLLLFSSRLAYRIKNLQREVSTAIDPDGRLVKDAIETSKNKGDEVGELSRGFSSLLTQLKSYTGFLESVPRTLRHEILNPINTISMTLQKMSSENQFDKKLVDSAGIALRQLELIVQSLTEAAHIEDALSQEEKEAFDLASLISEYVSNIKLKHPGIKFRYTGPESGVTIEGSDLRITQLLDKLKDNAIDFAAPGTEITFQITTDSAHTVITICNEGPSIPDDIRRHLCSGILSHRVATDGEPHLGIGLYVAGRIAQYHAGKLTVTNKQDDSGVCVSTSLPAVKN